MPDASQNIPPTAPSTLGDFEGLLPPVLKSKQVLPSVFPRLASVIRRNPLVLATILCMVLAGGTVGIVNFSYNREMKYSDEAIQMVNGSYDKSGVSFSHCPS